MLLPDRDTQRYTYADYLTWTDDLCVGLIDGVAYVREPPGPSRVHQEWVGDLYLQVRAALEGKRCRAYVAPFDVRLPKSASSVDQIDTAYNPTSSSSATFA